MPKKCAEIANYKVKFKELTIRRRKKILKSSQIFKGLTLTSRFLELRKIIMLPRMKLNNSVQV